MHLSNDVTQALPGEVPLGKSLSPRANFQLSGVWLLMARGAWISFILFELLVVFIALMTTDRQALTICPFIVSCAVTPATAQALRHLGLTPSSYIIYNLVLTALQSLVFLLVGGVLFWRKSSEPVSLMASYFLVGAALASLLAPSTHPLVVAFSAIGGVSVFGALGYFLVTFPDSRFVPRWSWVLVVLWLVQALFFVISGPFNIRSWPPLLFAAEELLTYGGTVGVLIYRYVRVFTFSQRQQAKWLLFGFAGLIVMVTLYDLLASVFPALAAPDSLYHLAGGTLATVMFLSMPLSLAIAIQYYRLWDIDVLINRAIVYGMLTISLGLIYFGLVIGLQALVHLVTGQAGQSPVVIVASTLAIAALFQPLHRRIQAIIDRRFYRRKYNATKTLAAFSTTLRQEVDLDQLREELITVVQETMQPSHVSLWLRLVATAGKPSGAWSSEPPAPQDGQKV